MKHCYSPLPTGLTIKNSPIEGLGLYTTKDITQSTVLGITHVVNHLYDNKLIRTPLGGFINHSLEPNVKMVPAHKSKNELLFESISFPCNCYVFMALREIKTGEELVSNYTGSPCVIEDGNPELVFTECKQEDA